MPLRTSEVAVLVYLAYVVLASCLLPVGARRRLRIAAAAGAVAALVWLISSVSPARAPNAVRDWAPNIWLLAGYWISGQLFVGPMPWLERQLLRSDAWLFARAGVDAWIRRSPAAILTWLEVAYVCCYPLIPAGLASLYLLNATSEVDRYWTLVLSAEFVCYAALPWLQSRPPRSLETQAAIDSRDLAVRRLNLRILQRGSIQANTLPSAHTAGAVAVALAVAHVNPVLGWAFGGLAFSIAVGSVVGRYHYAVDAVAGAVVALALALVVQRPL